MNSLPTHDIDSQHIVIANTWNRQKQYVFDDLEIVSEN